MITDPGSVGFFSSHAFAYVPEAHIMPLEIRPKCASVSDFKRISARCVCGTGLRAGQHAKRMPKVRADFEDVAVYRLGVGIKHIQLGELAVDGRDEDGARAIPILQVLTSGRFAVNARGNYPERTQ